jgi:hypothetical protein
MATTTSITAKTRICNIALTQLGELKIEDVENDENERARLCNLRFDDCLKLVLRSHPWTCVTKRVKLNLTDTKPAFGFTYMFELPSDFLRVIQVDNVQYPYKIEVHTINEGQSTESTSAPVLLSDASAVSIRYIHIPNNYNILSPDVANLVGLRLATELAEPLTSKTDLKTTLDQRMMVELGMSRSVDSMQGSPEIIEGSTWLDSRTNGSATSDRTFYTIDPNNPTVRQDVPSSGYPANYTSN